MTCSLMPQAVGWGLGASWSEFFRKTKQLLKGRTPADALCSWDSAGLAALWAPPWELVSEGDTAWP